MTSGLPGRDFEPTTDRDCCLQVLVETPGMAYTTQEVADVLELPRKSVCVHLRALHEQGKVSSSRTGRRGVLATYWWER